MNVRYATEDDIPHILRMAELFWSKTDYNVPFDPDSIMGLINACMGQRMLMVLDDGHPVGFVAGVVFPLMANNAYTIGAELAWWVDEEYRSGRNGLALMGAIEGAAKDAGVNFWTMMNLESLNPEVAETIYRRAGYKKTESTFLKVL